MGASGGRSDQWALDVTGLTDTERCLGGLGG